MVRRCNRYMGMKLPEIIRDTTLCAKYAGRAGCAFDEEKHTRYKGWVLFREKGSRRVLLKKKEGKHRSGPAWYRNCRFAGKELHVWSGRPGANGFVY